MAATFAAYTFRSQRNDLETERQRTRLNLHRAEQAEKDLRNQLELTQDAERNGQQRTAPRQHRPGKLAADRRRGPPARGHDRSAVQEPRPAHGGRADILRDDPEGRDRIPQIRDHVIAAMGLTDLRIIASTPPSGEHAHFCCDAQFERYAYVDSRTRETVVRRLADGFELMRLPPPKIVCWYAKANFSPDGDYLRVRYAVQGELGVTEIWDLARRERVFREETRSDAFLFHPNGRHFFYAPPGRAWRSGTSNCAGCCDACRSISRNPTCSRSTPFEARLVCQ